VLPRSKDQAKDWDANLILSPKHWDIESLKIALEQGKHRHHPISPKMKKITEGYLFANIFISAFALQMLLGYTEDRSLTAMIGAAKLANQ